MTTGKDVQNYVLSDKRMKRKTTIWDMCKQSSSLLLTGGAVVRDGYATLITGSGTDNVLEATCQYPNQVDGIIGNGRSILFDARERILYNMHFSEEVEHYFKEEYTKRCHKPLMSAESSNRIIIMNLEFIVESEVGKNIKINQPSKRRKRIRNFASKASHVREGDILLSWKETIPMSFEYIYKQMKQLGMNYYTVVTPIYDRGAGSYVLLNQGYVNPHEPVLEKLLSEKVI
jgi:hypothetical protein